LPNRERPYKPLTSKNGMPKKPDLGMLKINIRMSGSLLVLIVIVLGVMWHWYGV
jgi:hypothetical protein